MLQFEYAVIMQVIAVDTQVPTIRVRCPAAQKITTNLSIMYTLFNR